MIILLLLVVLIIVLILVYTSILQTIFFDAPFVPTGRKSMAQIFDIIKLKTGVQFYDLGSGDGRLVRVAARLGARATGIERALFLVLYSRIFARFQGLKTATFICKDFKCVSFADADVIYMYLFPKVMDMLLPKLKKELRPGTLVYSRAFLFHDLLPSAIHQMGKYRPPLYEYKF